MKFSIVTISFNQAEFLERTIKSVISQEGVDFEYIIVDPGSTDGSRDIIERYRKHFAHVIYDKDRGPADGLNNGFALATGDWLGYLNSDDCYLPGGLAKAAAAAARRSDAGAIIGDGVIVDANDAIIRHSFSKRFSLRAVRYGAAFALQQATFYRAEAFRAAGGFNISNRTCWDGEILVDMALSGRRVEQFSADVGAFRIHGASITGSGRLTEQYLKDSARVSAKIGGRPLSAFERKIVKPSYRLYAYLRTPIKTIRLVESRLLRF